MEQIDHTDIRFLAEEIANLVLRQYGTIAPCDPEGWWGCRFPLIRDYLALNLARYDLGQAHTLVFGLVMDAVTEILDAADNAAAEQKQL